MRARRCWLLLLLWIAGQCSGQIMPQGQPVVTGQKAAAQARQHGGAWQAGAVGAALSRRGVVAESPPLSAAEAVNGVMTLVTWRYQLSTPPPPGLQVQLCLVNRCVVLEGQSGSTQEFNGVAANQALRFAWLVPGEGALFPLMQVMSNQVIVNYVYTHDH